MRHDPLFTSWLVQCASAEESQRLRQRLRAAIHPDSTYADVVRPSPEDSASSATLAYRLGAHLNPFQAPTMNAWHFATAYFHTRTASLSHAQLMGWALIDSLRQQQAAALAYYDVFWAFSLVGPGLLPLLLLMRRSVAQKGAHVAAE